MGFVIASAVFLPLFAVLLLVPVSLVYATIGIDSPEFVLLPLVSAYAAIANWPKIALGVLSAAAITLVSAYSHRKRTKYHSVLFVVYCATLTAYASCAIWAAIAKPVVEF